MQRLLTINRAELLILTRFWLDLLYVDKKTPSATDSPNRENAARGRPQTEIYYLRRTFDTPQKRVI